jgi:hypothetical protein
MEDLCAFPMPLWQGRSIPAEYRMQTGGCQIFRMLTSDMMM